MKGLLIIIIFSYINLAFSSISFENLGHRFYPKDQFQYVEYLKLLLGRQDQSTRLPAKLTQIRDDFKMTQANSLNQVTIVFMPYSAEDNLKHRKNLDIWVELKGQLLKQLVFGTPRLFMTTNLPVSQQKSMLKTLIDASKKTNKTVHTIRGKQQQMRRLSTMLSQEYNNFDLQEKYKKMMEERG